MLPRVQLRSERFRESDIDLSRLVVRGEPPVRDAITPTPDRPAVGPSQSSLPASTGLGR